MHAVAFHVLRTAQRPISRPACRIIGGIRHSLPRRNFHRSAISYRIPEDPATETGRKDVPSANRKNSLDEAKASDKGKENTASPNLGHKLYPDKTNADDIERRSRSLRPPEHELDDLKVEGDTAADLDQPVDVESWTLSQRRRPKSGSGRLRANRPRQPEGLPPVVLPDWFFQKNVKCVGDPDLSSGSLAVNEDGNPSDESASQNEIGLKIKDSSGQDVPTIQNAKYIIDANVYRELLSSVKAALALRPPRNLGISSIPRPVTLLQCPKDGGTYYLDSIVETIATKLGADLVRLDAQDIAELVSVDENIAWGFSKAALLGYDAHDFAGKLEDYDKEAGSEEEDLDTEDDDQNSSRMFRTNKASSSASSVAGTDARSIANKLASILGSSHSGSRQPKLPSFESVPIIFSNPNPQTQTMPSSAPWNDLKVASVLDALVCAADLKRTSPVELEDSKRSNSESMSRNVIIQVRDFKELNGTQHGAELLRRLRNAVNRRWGEGNNIILVGTTSSEEGEPALSRSEIQHLQSDIVEGEKRTIFIPPHRHESQDDTFESDEKARIFSINIRHIEDMIRKLADGHQNSPLVVDIRKDLENATAYAAGLEDAVFTYARVHRLATTILGLDISQTSIDGSIFTKAWKILGASDEAKFLWGAAELAEEDEEVNSMIQDLNESSASTTTKSMKDKIQQIRKTCTFHEKKLLGGVIMPSDIHTTFADIRAPKETVEALKTLTSLSLTRPEAFSYGVLATDKIPGLLLYGPPGTGKTLLAKAVAKESGATVLEISGADVNDMYVGEGEKNVKAIFTLAKKLSPCVVFLDEADSLLASRGGGEAKRTSHRETINQFLKEWDGLNSLSAFMMVATNRPFDLDEAVLRRLPRRLLVDLPVEKDREAILQIHLKDEILNPEVSLGSIAKNTQFYSGSDLKNLSVAAALACIREENEVAARHTGEESYVYPEKRTLMKHHFDKALEEISASISEDMSTLTAIRKFDEKYGDRKGRRKKTSALGFGGTTVPDKDSEAARVRNVEA